MKYRYDIDKKDKRKRRIALLLEMLCGDRVFSFFAFLQTLAELYLLAVGSFNGEKLDAVLPEGKAVNLGVEHFQLGTLRHLEQLVNVLYIDGDVVNGAIDHGGLMVLVSFNDEVVKLQKRHFLVTVLCAQGNGEAQREIEVDGCLNVVGGYADVLHARCEIFYVHNASFFEMFYKFIICAPIWKKALSDCGFHMPMTCTGKV